MLASDTRLGLTVSWMSDASKIRRHVFKKVIIEPRNEITARLPGTEIGGTVHITTALVLLDDNEDALPGAPRHRGSILARDSVATTLEGDGSMFPMAVVDFAGKVYDNDASWHVETTTALDANFSSTFQVMINERDVHLIRAIETEKPTREQQALLDELSAGVMQTVIELAYALKSRGELTTDDYADGTVGDVLRGILIQTGDMNLADMSDPSSLSIRRSTFQGVARRISAGRMF